MGTRKTPEEMQSDLDARDRAAALVSAASAGDIESAKRLLALGCNIDENNGDRTPLVIAIENEQWAFARWLVEVGADPNAPGYDGCRPLHNAVDLVIDAQVQNGPLPKLESEVLAMIEWLLVRGADPTLTDVRGETPWDLTRRYSSLGVVEKLRPLLAPRAT